MLKITSKTGWREHCVFPHQCVLCGPQFLGFYNEISSWYAERRRQKGERKRRAHRRGVGGRGLAYISREKGCVVPFPLRALDFLIQSSKGCLNGLSALNYQDLHWDDRVFRPCEWPDRNSLADFVIATIILPTGLLTLGLLGSEDCFNFGVYKSVLQTMSVIEMLT